MTLYEYYTTGDDANDVIRAAAWTAQTFTVGTVGSNVAFNITSVKIYCYRFNLPGTVTVSIKAVDGDGLPTGPDLCSGTTDGNTINIAGPPGSPYDWREIEMSDFILQPSIQYAIVVRAPDGDTSNYLGWRVDSTNATYGGGKYIYSIDSGASWPYTFDTRDLLFEVYGTEMKGGNLSPNKGDYAKTKIGKMTAPTKKLIAAGIVE